MSRKENSTNDIDKELWSILLSHISILGGLKVILLGVFESIVEA